MIRAALVLLVLVGVLPAPDAAHPRHGPVIFFPIPFPYYYPTYYPTPVVYREPVYYVSPPPAYVIAPREYESAPAPSYLSNPPTWMTPGTALRQDVKAIQREVVYPHGRYVLRGDGVGMPYAWMWIPNPPGGPAAGDGL